MYEKMRNYKGKLNPRLSICVFSDTVSTSMGSLTEMQDLRPSPRLSGLGSNFNNIP